MKAVLKYFLLYLLLYFLGAMVLAIPAMIVESIVKGVNMDPDHLSGWTMSILILGSQILPLYVFLKKKYSDLSFIKDPNLGRLLAWMFVGWLGCYLLLGVVLQYMPVFDWDVDILSSIEDMALNPLGVICVCCLAPLVEECVFRGAIERRLLEKNWNPIWAIVISALIFGIFHMNLLQGMTAFILGLFLGWVYYRTRNIWLCIFVHAVNNTWSTVASFIWGGDELIGEVDKYPIYVNLLLLVAAIVLLYAAVRLTGKTIGSRIPPIPTTASEPTDDDLQTPPAL